jgi:hypothetical protein
MQPYTVYFIWKLLCMFPDIINGVMLHLVGYILEDVEVIYFMFIVV